MKAKRSPDQALDAFVSSLSGSDTLKLGRSIQVFSIYTFALRTWARQTGTGQQTKLDQKIRTEKLDFHLRSDDRKWRLIIAKKLFLFTS